MAAVAFIITLADEASGDHVLARIVDQGFTVGPMPPAQTVYTRARGTPVVLALVNADRSGDRGTLERILPQVLEKACQGQAVLSAVAQLRWGQELITFCHVPPALLPPAATPKGKAGPASPPNVYDKIGE